MGKRKKKPKTAKKTSHTQILEYFFLFKHTLTSFASGASDVRLAMEYAEKTVGSSYDEDDHRDECQKIWRYMSRAVIIEVSSVVYGHLYHQTDVHITTDLCGFEWKPGGPYTDGPPGSYAPPDTEWCRDEGRKVLDVTMEEGIKQPFPDLLPFEVCYLGYHPGIKIDLVKRAVYKIPNEVKDPVLRSHLLTEDGNVWALISGKVDEGPWWRDVMLSSQERHPMGWRKGTAAVALSPWILPALIRVINGHRSTTIETIHGYSYKLKCKRAMKKVGLKRSIPPPYYAVEMKDEIHLNDVRPTNYGGKTWELSHQFIVRGHECCKIKRGRRPIKQEDREKLEKREYRIYTDGQIKDEDWERLLKRGIKDRRPDEWIAIKTWWRKEFVKGPSGAPFIPSTRTAKKLSGKEPLTGKEVLDGCGSTPGIHT